jgi:serine protease Do
MQGFTIPINIAIDVMDKLLATGTIERGYIGIVVQPLNRSYAKYYKNRQMQGLVVADVFEGEAADRAGIKPGDIILSYDDQQVAAENDDDLTKFTLDMSQSKAGDKKKFEIYRDGKIKKIDVTVGQKPKVKPDEFETPFNFTVEEITDHMFRNYLLQTREGVYVDYVEVGSAADKGDLMAGDIITQIDNQKVKNFDDFKKIMENAGEPEFMMLRVLRGKAYAYALLDFTEEDIDKKNQDK